MREIVLVGAAMAACGWYAALCAWSPLGRCRACRGRMVHARRGPKVLRWWLDKTRGAKLCRRCDATGRRIRIGRRAYDHLRRLQRAGNR